jgi:rhodanese-related sulfurtransferase
MTMAFAEISVEEAARRRDEFHAIDVRAEFEFRGPLGHVPRAVLVPLPELEARARELPRDRTLLLICRSGARSGKACEALQSLGLDRVVNMTGGMIAWNKARLAVEEEPPASLAALFEQVARWVAQVSAQPPDAVRASLGGQLEALGASASAPTRDALARLLEYVASSLAQKGAPPDLELSMAAFRRWLAAL